jgi:gentisate 1,2-dioxygenase
MDGLDIALVNLLDASFSQNSNRKEQEVTRVKETSQTRYGANLLPIDDAPISLNSPLMRYPYDQARATLERMKASSAADPCHGIRMRYAHPRTGDWAMPTMGPAIQLIPKGFNTAPYRATDGAIFAVAEGRGTAIIGEASFALTPRDVFVCPPWAWRKFRAEDDLVLFTFSDRPVQEKLALWREERGATQ